MKLSQKKKAGTILLVSIAVIITAIHIIPLLVILLNSFRSNQEIEMQMLAFPTSLDFTNYIVAWNDGGYAEAYQSSLIIGVSTAVAELLLIGLAVYGLTKTNCYFKNFFRSYFVAGLAIPAFAILVPLYFFFSSVGLINSHLGMIIIYTATNMSFNFMFLSAFFEGMPKELDEAARIDGASEMQNFFYNVLPLAKPIFTSVILITFVNTWNEFLFSNTFLQDRDIRTVSLRFYNFVGSTNTEFGDVYAAALISMLPIVAIYLLTQNTFVEGMTSGSVKG